MLSTGVSQEHSKDHESVTGFMVQAFKMIAEWIETLNFKNLNTSGQNS